MGHSQKLKCPSASKHIPGSKVFGLIIDDPGLVRTAYLDSEAEEALASASLAADMHLDRTNARFSADCQEGKCGNFVDHRCKISRNLVDFLQPVVDALPRCTIRPTCRWFSEEREHACFRCPQVATISRQNKPEVGIQFSMDENKE